MILLHGLPADWNASDVGERVIYTMPPVDIPHHWCARVIYELRLDCDRLNGEVIAARKDQPMTTRLTKVYDPEQTSFSHEELAELAAWVADETRDPQEVAYCVSKPWKFWPDYVASLSMSPVQAERQDLQCG